MKIQIFKPAVVDTLEVKLPMYFKVNDTMTMYAVITEDMRMLEIHERSNGTVFSIDTRKHDDMHEVEAYLKHRTKGDFELISEAVFHHKFMVHHRELFYVIFPDARPSI